LNFASGDSSGNDQPAGAQGGPATVSGRVDGQLEPDLGSLGFPYRGDALAFEGESATGLADEGFAPDRGAFHFPGKQTD
jgi:hypothetical protein